MRDRGIGLALVKELVKLHGGTVDVRSQLREGSTFRVRIPCGTSHLPSDRIAAPRTLSTTGVHSDAYLDEALRWLPDPVVSVSPAQAIAHSTPLSSRGKGQRILLADDNADMREYVRRLLTNSGYEVIAVADGEAALLIARMQPIDLILSDVMMPRLDGFGLISALRSEEKTATVPVILLSARCRW
jgi:hypothetical protein